MRELQQLTGLLNFLTRAIYPRRAFTRRMYAKFSFEHTGQKIIKQHHHVQLDEEFKKDCWVWLSFLETSHKAICRPFVNLDKTVRVVDLGFATDAAKGEHLGYGGICGKHWIFARWEDDYIKKFDPSIAYLELYGLISAIFAWSEILHNKRVKVECDNISVVQIINTTSSSCKNCIQLIQFLTMRGLEYNFRVIADWIPGKSNIKPDLLSRQKIQCFKEYSAGDGMDEFATKPPAELWPASKIWIK